MGDHFVKVGVDFGTTYSGVAWVHTAKAKDMNILQWWPVGHNSDKVPSEIAYNESFQPYGYKWGFEAHSLENKIYWPKLLLDRRRNPEVLQMQRRIRSLLPHNKTPVDVVADFLSALARHLKETLIRRYSEGFMETTRVEYVLTVPAVWSDGAKALTLEAAERAGFGSRGSIELIGEPEAAAVYSLPLIQPNHLKVGDTFVVADCGGGTVDLVSYEITKLLPLEVIEHATGGDLCGSAFINRAFEILVSGRLGQQFSRMQQKPRLRMQSRLFQDFEALKRTVTEGDGKPSYSFDVPGLEDDEEAGIDDELLVLTKRDMIALFDPVIDQVVNLVQEQVEIVETNGLKASGILLVGGFGSSEYLYEQLQKRIKSSANDASIPIMRPSNAWTAVVRGAIQKSLVKARIIRRHYGICIRVPFIVGIHPESDKIWNRYTQKWECTNRACWFIYKGTRVKSDQEIRHLFCNEFPATYSRGVIQTTLYICEQDAIPESTQETSVYKLCVLNSDLRNVPSRRFKRRTSPIGEEYKTLDYYLIMRYNSAQLVFSMEINGIEYSNVKAEFI